MKTEKFEGSAKTAFGKAVADYGIGKDEITFSGEVQVFESADEIKSAGEWPNDAAIVKMVNAAALAAARAKAQNAAFDEVGIKKPTIKDSPEERFRQMVLIFKSAGQDDATARQSANAALGTSY